MKYYKITYKHINSLEVEVTVTIQEDPSITIYKFIDKLITLPRLDIKDILIERKVMGRRDELYIIDVIQFQILLLKSLDVNKGLRSYIPKIRDDKKFVKEDLNKFITLDMETTTGLEKLEDYHDTKVTAIHISSFNFFDKSVSSIPLYPTDG